MSRRAPTAVSLLAAGALATLAGCGSGGPARSAPQGRDAGSPAARPAGPPRIAYAAAASGFRIEPGSEEPIEDDTDIWAIDPDGGGRERLTRTPVALPLAHPADSS